MNELAKTGVYLVAAAASLGVAWWARPATIQKQTFNDTGERFFEPFDPLSARSMVIVSYAEGASAPLAFKVSQENGRWTIPSHEGYAADAQEHLSKAATAVMDLQKGTMVSDVPIDHDIFGVSDPSADGAHPGAGTRVTLKDSADKTLVDLIIGKPVKESQNLRYVRAPGKDRVYTTKVDTQQLTTKFEDWIERDLLKLSAWQITDVTIDDYSVDEVNNTIKRGDTLKLHYTQKDNKWSLEGLAEGENVIADKLEAMRTALSDVKIIDVHRKPAGLASQLQGGGDMRVDANAVASLMSRGYFIYQGQLLSNQGEMTIRTNEGVEYSLRFGALANVESAGDLNNPDSEAAANQTGRYLFVTARFDQNLIELPKYDPIPEVPTPGAEATSQPEGAATQPAASQPNDPAAFAAEQARAKVIHDNDQKRTDYQKKITDGQDKVKELNARFADWYYVVSDGVYQKLKLRRVDFVTKGPVQPEDPTPPPGLAPGLLEDH